MLKYHKFPLLDFGELSKGQSFVLLESNRFRSENDKSYLFLNPREIITAKDFADVETAFQKIASLSSHYFLAGYLAYELGYYWENPKLEPSNLDSPLIWLGVFAEEDVCIFDHQKNEFNRPIGDLLAASNNQEEFSVTDAKISISREAYFDKIEKIKSYIEAGDTYQVNFTTDFQFKFSGNPYAFYQSLKAKQAVDYNALIGFDNTTILSVSPELYFRKDGTQITTRPMKGTMPRGRFPEEDRYIAESLKNDVKNRSENIMIVDLMRNDLGRISEAGSVQVKNKFEVEKYNSLFQMTATIKSTLKSDVNYTDIFRNLFPCGSVTGAPKIRTMEIIHKLESGPRGVYTGAIGFISPHNQAIFNVPIRTITLNGSSGKMGVGSGIVYDSNAQGEYEECLLKAKFLVEEFREFSLIETMLFDGGFALLPLHLERLQSSAEYFDFEFDHNQIEQKVINWGQEFSPSRKYKVRLLLNRLGEINISAEKIAVPILTHTIIRISEKRTSSRDRFLFHKTTLREIYNEEYAASVEAGFYDVIFMNENDEITEGSISNIFIKKGNMFYTPPVKCGLLNGVCRQNFLNKNSNTSERKLFLNDLLEADAIYLTNAVRGMVQVILPT